MELSKLRQLTQKQWHSGFAVYVAEKGLNDSVPAILGKYQIRSGGACFIARFPLRNGLRYQVVLKPDRLLPKRKTKSEIRRVLRVPARRLPPVARVTQIFPSADALPENQLKFYIHFTAPMLRGEAYKHIYLLDEKGKRIAEPFLELGEELWDPDETRFTLFIHPGRIKRGLKPREDNGPVLEKGKHYVLVVDGKWKDEFGRPIQKSLRKKFRVVAQDTLQPNPSKWRKTLPSANSKSRLTISFGESLDHAMLFRALAVTRQDKRPVAGKIVVDQRETKWHFLPAKPWKKGTYLLRVSSTLEDLAGNTIERPFEVKIRRNVKRPVVPKVIEVPIVVR